MKTWYTESGGGGEDEEIRWESGGGWKGVDKLCISGNSISTYSNSYLL